MANRIELSSYVARIEADTSGLNTGLDQADGLLKGKIGGMANWSKLAIGGMVAGVVAGIGVTIKKGIDSFVEFENQMNSVYTLLPDITDTAMTQMEDQVKELSKSMGILPDEIIPALYSSLSASVPEDNVFQFLETAQKGAIAGMTEAETVVDGLTTVLNSYHMEATEADSVSDILFTTIKKGKTSMEELSASMSNVTPVSASLGVEFGDIGAALATMTAQGANTATSSTQLKQMMIELSKAGGDTSNIFQELAGKSFKEFIAEGHNVNEALSLMEGYAKDNGVEINDLFGSVQAGQAALMLTGESAQVFAQNIEEMGNSAGATDEAFNTMNDGIGRSFERIKTNMSIMVLELGEKLAPVVKSAVDYIEEAMPQIQATIETVFSVIGEVIKTFVTVIDWLVENITQFVADNEELFNSVAETIKTVFDSIIKTVNLFIDAFKVYWDAYGKYIINYIEIVWDTVSGVFKGALDTIQGIVNLFISVFKGDWDGMGKAIQQITEGLWKIIMSLFEGSLNYIKNIMDAAITTLTNIARSIMEGIWNAFKEIWEYIKTWTSESFTNLANSISSFGSRFYKVGREIFSYVWNGMKDIWSDIRSWVSDKVSWMADKLAFWKKSKSEMSTSGGSSSGGIYTVPSVPSYDVGTPFVPNDQLAFLHKGEAVIPAKYNPYNGGQGIGGGVNSSNDTYEVKIEVKGNLDRSILPEVKRMITEGIDKAQEQKISKYKDVGIRRPVY